ncbi:MAG: DcrB-related protein [Blastocatellia bacterium]|nr:DcrB-related protein [Blastocatellia bacterium]
MRMIANGFLTDLPSGWSDRSMITLVGSTGESGFAANVVVIREVLPKSTTLKDYVMQQKKAMQDEIAGVEILDERPISIGNLPAYQRLQRFSLEGQTIQQAQTFIAGNGLVFAITCSANVEEFDANIEAFRHITTSFKLFSPEDVKI